MRKRIKKKYHIGPWAQRGFKVHTETSSNRATDDELDSFVNNFLALIEINKLGYTGVIQQDDEKFILSGYIASVSNKSCTETDIRVIHGWLEANPLTKDLSLRIGPLLDIHYGQKKPPVRIHPRAV